MNKLWLYCTLSNSSDVPIIARVVALQSWTQVTSLYGETVALASATLDDQLFVTRYPDTVPQVSVYNTTTFKLQRQIKFAALGIWLLGLATSSRGKYLFISDQENSCVHRVDLPVTNIVSVMTWNVDNVPRGLSVTHFGNVLVVTDGRYNSISEYTPGGLLVRNITDGSAMWHAVEVSDGLWAISRRGPVHGIAVITTNGTVLRSFGSAAGSEFTQMDDPRGLAVDTNGNILVADRVNNRILVVNPSLTVARLLQVPDVSKPLRTPISLSLERGRLYVAEDYGLHRVLVLAGNSSSI